MKKIKILYNVLQLTEVGDYEAQNLNIKRMLNRSRNVDITTEPPILVRCCVCPAYAGHTPKAFQIVQKYKFSFTNQVFGVLFFQRVQVPYERIETPNR